MYMYMYVYIYIYMYVYIYIYIYIYTCIHTGGFPDRVFANVPLPSKPRKNIPYIGKEPAQAIRAFKNPHGQESPIYAHMYYICIYIYVYIYIYIYICIHT